jgi:putative NADH-flavin reductase
MRLLVFGASGNTGREIVRQSLARGHDVSAFVREPTKLESVSPAVRVIRGNVNDEGAVAAAIPGHDAVVSALGVGTPLSHDPEVIAGVRHITRAMEHHGVRRLVYLSFIGVRESRHAVGFVLRYVASIPLRHEIADHEAKEDVIVASGLDWTIVRAPKLTNGARTERYRVGEDISTLAPLPLLSRADVAHFILDEVAQPRFVRKAPRLLH